mgnify:CR=1 FL=1
MEIEHQIQRLEMGEEVEVYEDYQIEPRYNSLNKLAKELLSDFKEVDDNFKGIIKEIYERQTENAEKKALLNYIFDALWRTKQSQQGKSSMHFGVLLSADLQKNGRVDWCTLQNAGNRGIDAHDMFSRK